MFRALVMTIAIGAAATAGLESRAQRPSIPCGAGAHCPVSVDLATNRDEQTVIGRWSPIPTPPVSRDATAGRSWDVGLETCSVVETGLALRDEAW